MINDSGSFVSTEFSPGGEYVSSENDEVEPVVLDEWDLKMLEYLRTNFGIVPY